MSDGETQASGGSVAEGSVEMLKAVIEGDTYTSWRPVLEFPARLWSGA